MRGGTRPTTRRPHGNAINISSFSPCHARQHNRSIVNFDVFLHARRTSTCQTTKLFLMLRKKTALSSRSECSAMRPSWTCVFLFRFVVASRVARSPQLERRQLVAVSDNMALLTRVTKLWVRHFVVFVSLL